MTGKIEKPFSEGKIEKPSLKGKFEKPSLEGTVETSSKMYTPQRVPHVCGEQQTHFMNVCRLQNGLYTCAVDTFLEVVFASFSSLIEKIETRSYSFEMLVRCFESYSVILDCCNDSSNEQNLSLIRQPIWD